MVGCSLQGAAKEMRDQPGDEIQYSRPAIVNEQRVRISYRSLAVISERAPWTRPPQLFISVHPFDAFVLIIPCPHRSHCTDRTSDIEELERGARFQPR